MRAVLKAQINKTDRNDARGMAQMMRVGLYRPVHVKTLRSQKLRMLLTHRKLLQSQGDRHREIPDSLQAQKTHPEPSALSQRAGRLWLTRGWGSWGRPGSREA